MMSKPKTDPKPFDQMAPEERAAYVRTLRDEARGIPYNPQDDSLSILATALGSFSTRH
jgi:hypothetical protein